MMLPGSSWKQLPFRFHSGPSFDVHDLIVSNCNYAAAKWLEQWPGSFSEERIVCLVGDSGFGKSALASWWGDRNTAAFIEKGVDVSSLLQSFSGFPPNKCFVLDDADTFAEDIFLFYVYNSIVINKSYLLATAKLFPSNWSISLADLKSRVLTAHVLSLAKPDEQLLSVILKSTLKQKGIALADEVISYITSSPDLNCNNIKLWADKIDSLVNLKKEPNLRNIKKLTAQQYVA
jgi:chromosomal replication initiation ATPase DnaA